MRTSRQIETSLANLGSVVRLPQRQVDVETARFEDLVVSRLVVRATERDILSDRRVL